MILVEALPTSAKASASAWSGARGYLTKDASAEQIEAAIRAVHAGQTHLDPLVQERLVATVTTQPPEGPMPGTRPLPAGLTTREAEVLTLLAAGLSNTEIAQRLFASKAPPPDLARAGSACSLAVTSQRSD